MWFSMSSWKPLPKDYMQSESNTTAMFVCTVGTFSFHDNAIGEGYVSMWSEN